MRFPLLSSPSLSSSSLSSPSSFLPHSSFSLSFSLSSFSLSSLSPSLSLADVEAPDYSRTIPVGMPLSLLSKRCNTEFYRQPQALVGDARTLYLNCRAYNNEGTDITSSVS